MIQLLRTIAIVEDNNRDSRRLILQSICSTVDCLTEKLKTTIAKFSHYPGKKYYRSDERLQDYSTIVIFNILLK